MIKAKYGTSSEAREQNLILVIEGDQSTLPFDFAELFTGEEKSVRVEQTGDRKYFLLGLGKSITAEKLKSLGEYYSQKIGYELASRPTSFQFPRHFDISQRELFLIGFLSGIYRIDEESKKKHFLESQETLICLPDFPETSWSKALHIAEGRTLARRWLDRGQNKKTAPILTSFLTDWAETMKLEIKVLNQSQCEEHGLSAYLAVNQGSLHNASFTVLDYNPGHSLFHLGLVGKCITFDTGGISIKSSTNLHYMKSDMGGATAVIGAVHAMVSQQLPIRITAILPITDNAVDRTAYVPSDVIFSHAGKRIEIIDTDAEGRLTLADGLSYLVKEYGPDVVLDLATLTGSAVRTLGTAAAALFSDNEQLRQQLIRAGSNTGEKLWHLPMWKEYRQNLDSDIADLKNYSGKPLSGASDAAAFLKEFTHGHSSWAHLDIAGVAYGKTHFGKDKSATSYGVHLIYHLVELLIQDLRDETII